MLKLNWTWLLEPKTEPKFVKLQSLHLHLNSDEELISEENPVDDMDR